MLHIKHLFEKVTSDNRSLYWFRVPVRMTFDLCQINVLSKSKIFSFAASWQLLLTSQSRLAVSFTAKTSVSIPELELGLRAVYV